MMDASPREPSNSTEILRADPRWRAAMLALVSLGFVAGGFLVWIFQRRIDEAEQLATHSPQEAAIGVLRLATAQISALGVGLALLGLYFVALGWRSLRSERFPPPGTKVMRDTRLLRGPAARRRGLGACLIGLVFVVGGLAVPRFALDRLEGSLAAALSGELEPEPVEFDESVGIAPRSPR